MIQTWDFINSASRYKTTTLKQPWRKVEKITTWMKFIVNHLEIQDNHLRQWDCAFLGTRSIWRQSDHVSEAITKHPVILFRNTQPHSSSRLHKKYPKQVIKKIAESGTKLFNWCFTFSYLHLRSTYCFGILLCHLRERTDRIQEVYHRESCKLIIENVAEDLSGVISLYFFHSVGSQYIHNAVVLDTNEFLIFVIFRGSRKFIMPVQVLGRSTELSSITWKL